MIGYYPYGVPCRTLKDKVKKFLFGIEPAEPHWVFKVPQDKLLVMSMKVNGR